MTKIYKLCGMHTKQMDSPESYLTGRKAWPSTELLKPEDLWNAAAKTEGSGPILSPKQLDTVVAAEVLDPENLFSKETKKILPKKVVQEKEFSKQQEKDTLNQFLIQDIFHDDNTLQKKIRTPTVQWNSEKQELVLTLRFDVLGWILFALTALFALYQMWTLNARLFALEASLKQIK